MLNNVRTITVDISNQVVGITTATTANISGDLVIDSSASPRYTSISTPQHINNPEWSNINNNLILGESSDNTDIYICEEWETKKPIKIKEGMFASFKEDLYSLKDLQSMVYDVIEKDYPEKAIKLGLNKESITLRRHSIPIEIKIKD